VALTFKFVRIKYYILVLNMVETDTV